jgi:hypothetical protein
MSEDDELRNIIEEAVRYALRHYSSRPGIAHVAAEEVLEGMRRAGLAVIRNGRPPALDPDEEDD